MKKKLINSIILLSFSFVAGAQVQPGAVYPSLSFGRYVRDYNTNTLGGSVTVGLNGHSALGVFLNRTKATINPKTGNGFFIETEAGLSYTYYRHFRQQSKWGWYANGELGFSRIRFFDTGSGSIQFTGSYNERKLTLTPGIFFAPSKNVMLFGNVGSFSLNNSKNQGLEARSSFFNKIELGVRLTIGGNKKDKANK